MVRAQVWCEGRVNSLVTGTGPILGSENHKVARPKAFGDGASFDGTGLNAEWAARGKSAIRARMGNGTLLRSALSRVSETVAGLRGLRNRTAKVLGTPDGRWTVVSTTLTTGVALTVTWLSVAAVPASTAKTYEPQRPQAALPYDLLRRLAGISGDAGRYRSASLIVAPNFSGPVDRLLAAPAAPATPPVDRNSTRLNSSHT